MGYRSRERVVIPDGKMLYIQINTCGITKILRGCRTRDLDRLRVTDLKNQYMQI